MRLSLWISMLLIIAVRAAGLAAPCLLAPGCKRVLNENWAMQSSAKVRRGGAVISTTDFTPQNWYPAQMPATVLAVLVRNHVYPDPYFGMNLQSIRGASDPGGQEFSEVPMPPGSPFRPGWWYRTQFDVPASEKGKELWLHFDGINYRADVWINGHELATSRQVRGTWRTFTFNVTQLARTGARNALAVEVFPPTPHDLAITLVDWSSMPPDKDMGIFRDVYLTASGPVTVRHAQVITKLDLPSVAVAHLTISADLSNATGRPVRGALKAAIGSISVLRSVRLGPHETRRIIFPPQTDHQLNIPRPRLWWPWQYGAQNLYQLRIEFITKGHASDRQDIQFGIREISSYLGPKNNRIFTINGKRILIRGAGWAPDLLLRPSRQREEDQISYVRNLNLNTVRLEGKLMEDHFFNLCDRSGILVIAGWCCCSH
ncbi:MAG: glycoside hydrolase family 2 protein, partial [Terriglobia bacterium]